MRPCSRGASFLICTVTFTRARFSRARAQPRFLVAMRILQGLGGGSVIPMAQATCGRSSARAARRGMSCVGRGQHAGADPRPTVGGYIADNWSWRWYLLHHLRSACSRSSGERLPLRRVVPSAPRRVRSGGIILMVLVFGASSLLDLGSAASGSTPAHRRPGGLAVVMVAGFVIRELVADEPRFSICGVRRPELRRL